MKKPWFPETVVLKTLVFKNHGFQKPGNLHEKPGFSKNPGF
jgi:hypothetical protein